MMFDAVGAIEVSRAEPSNEEILERAAELGERGEHVEAIRLATQVVERDPANATAFYVRGRERFRAGLIQDSVADFDQYVALRPAIAPRQWERGIACYYAGRHAEGAKQFEDYQKFDGHDVENSVWRYLCQVPSEGVKRAQESMLAIEHDRRVPMMQVYDLYRGRLPAADVLAAVAADQPEPDILAGRLFYAHLYLGLWYEAQGDAKQARRYIELAADEKLKENRRINRYMWDVARIHWLILRGELPQAPARTSRPPTARQEPSAAKRP